MLPGRESPNRPLRVIKVRVSRLNLNFLNAPEELSSSMADFPEVPQPLITKRWAPHRSLTCGHMPVVVTGYLPVRRPAIEESQ